MTKQAANRDDDESAVAQLAARLQRELAERERQLRDLTEQSLGFLEELAEARRLNGDRERLAQRIGELERLLADARGRLQHAGGCATSPTRRGRKGAQAPALEVVFWGEGSLAAAVHGAAACGEVPVSWVGSPTAVPPDAQTGGVRMLVHRDAHTPAQCWNLGMAGTTADAVLFVGPGARVEAAPSLPDAIAPQVVVLCPLAEREGVASIGCAERDSLLHLEPLAAPQPLPAAPFRVPWAAADAFVLRRPAFERVGAFDEGLHGSYGLVDFVLRARAVNFDVFGASSPTVVVTPAEADDGPLARERLLVLAMHRPDQVGRALADLPDLWQLGTGELQAFLTALLARLPVGDLSVQRAVLDRIVAGVVQHALPAAQVCGLVQASRVALLRSCIDAELIGSDELDRALLRAESQIVTPVTAAFEALANDITMCRNVARATAQALAVTRRELAEIDQQRHAQSARAERADGARATAAQQLEQVQTWLREAQAETRQLQEVRREQDQRLAAAVRAEQEVLRLQAERQQMQQAQQEAQSLHEQAQQEVARLTAELDEARLLGQQANQRLAAQQQSHRELERDFLAADHDLRSMHEHTAELARIVGIAHAADRDQLASRLTFLLQESDRFANTLRTAGAPDERALLASLDALAKQLKDTERTLREREQWIATLLGEVTSRRLFPRDLQPHERAFVDRLGKPL